MSHYKHLTLLEREKILFFTAKGYSIGAIAKELGRCKATVSRELRRNSGKKGYIPIHAQKEYEKRRKICRKKKLLEAGGALCTGKEEFLEQLCWPQQIAGRIKLEGYPYSVSYNTIYRAIYAEIFDTLEQKRSTRNRGMKQRLRHKGKPRHKKAESTTVARRRFPIASMSGRNKQTEENG